MGFPEGGWGITNRNTYFPDPPLCLGMREKPVARRAQILSTYLPATSKAERFCNPGRPWGIHHGSTVSRSQTMRQHRVPGMLQNLTCNRRPAVKNGNRLQSFIRFYLDSSQRHPAALQMRQELQELQIRLDTERSNSNRDTLLCELSRKQCVQAAWRDVF